MGSKDIIRPNNQFFFFFWVNYFEVPTKKLYICSGQRDFMTRFEISFHLPTSRVKHAKETKI